MQLDSSVAGDHDAPHDLTRDSVREGIRGNRAIDERTCSNDRVIANSHATTNDALAADITIAADTHRRPSRIYDTSRDSPLDSVMRVNLHASTDAAVITYFEPT